MPGVPSGRGCEACRKQKKKCDQLKPACSRCTRLKIPCIGGGEQRYKFKEQMVITKTASKVEKCKQQPVFTVLSFPRSPSNESMRVANAFISRLEITDLRYDLSWYGDFLRDIPQRLGSNDALLASASALTSASSSLHTRQQSPETLALYGSAIKTLRFWLDDPVKARTPDTLCAIYLIMICQSWMGSNDDVWLGHGEGIAHILSAANFHEWQSSFEIEMLVTLCIPVILESIFNPKIQLHPWFWKLIDAYGPPQHEAKDPISSGMEVADEEFVNGSPIHSMKLKNLVKIPVFMRDPEAHLVEMEALYGLMRADARRLHHYLIKTSNLASPEALNYISLPTLEMKLRTRYQAAYGILLILAVTVNAVLRAFYPFNDALPKDAAYYLNEIMALPDEAAQFKPLGASYIPLCLLAAWAATDDPCKQMELEIMLTEDYTNTRFEKWIEGALWMKTRLERLRLKVLTSQVEKGRESAPNTKLDGSNVSEAGPTSQSCLVQ